MELQQVVLAHEPVIRFGFFLSAIVLVIVWELRAPRRVLRMPRTLRWFSNLGLLVLNTLLLRLVLPLAAAGIAAFGVANGWGLMNHFSVPLWLAVPVGVITMDLAIWLQHVMFHAVPALWRLHQVHHTDLDYDVTTGSRFHPVEIGLSMLIKFATIIVIGPPVVAVVIFEVLLNVTASFNHGNIRLPIGLDRVLRWFVVTPDMHRVHHSIEDDETNSNFGFNLPWWDRLFGTYRDQPRAGHEDMTVGVRGHTDPREVARLDGLLLLPFKGRVSGYTIDRRSWNGERTP